MLYHTIKSYLYTGSFKVLLLINLIVSNELIAKAKRSRSTGGEGESDSIASFFFFVIIGSLIWFFISLRRLRFHRFIRNIPTSKLGSLAVGLAEVNGKVIESDDLLRSPIHNVECVFYETFVEVYKPDGILEDKVEKVYRKTEYVQPFSINDGSGTVNVDLEDAHVEFEKDRGTMDQKWVLLPSRWKMGENEDFDNFCKKNNIKMKGKYKYHYNETYIEPGDEIYILGKAEIRAENENNMLTMCKDENNKNLLLVSDKGEKYMLKWSTGGQKYSILKSIILITISLAIILIRI